MGASATWLGRCRFSRHEEDDGVLRDRRLLYMFVRSHADKRELHESNVRSAKGDVCISYARFMETNTLYKATFPGIHGSPRTNENPEHGCVIRYSVLARCVTFPKK